ncbi:hypothetical protein [Mycolicibacterium goodii]|uniref:hypothetical protein n=1 Tax=Mycolicibacterium goodii TaxID=134601 RepID=UPI000B136BC8
MSTIARRIVATLTITAAPFLLLVGIATAHTQAHPPAQAALPHQVIHTTQN